MRRYSTPPPMSPATSSAHNFYSGFGGQPPSNSPPPSLNMLQPPSQQQQRPPSMAHNSNYYPQQQNSGYVNAQYYNKDPPGGLGLSNWGGGGPPTGGLSSMGITSPPPLQTTFGNLNLGGNVNTMSEEAYRKYIQQQHAMNSSPPPSMEPSRYAPQSQPLYNRATPPPISNNRSYNNGSQGIQRPPSSQQGSSRMPGSFPDEMSRNDLPLRSPIMGVKAAAAAAARAREDSEMEQAKGDSYWGTLFENNSGQQVAKPLAISFLRGIADYIIEEFEPRGSLVITPPKMMAFYTKFRSPTVEPLEWDNFFFGRPVKALSEVYQVLNCHHHLVPPKDSANSAPTVPGLTPRGFERWMTVQILSNPEREAKRLIAVLKQCPIEKSGEKDPMLRRFPKTLTREAFPKYADGDIKGVWDLLVPETDTPRTPQIPQGNRAPPNAQPVNHDRNRDLDARNREFEELERERERYHAEESSRPYSMIDEYPSNGSRMRDTHQYDDDLDHEPMPPPPLPNNGIERERHPYSRQVAARKEDPSLHDSDEEYYAPTNTQARTRPSPRVADDDSHSFSQQGSSKRTPKQPYLPSPGNSPPPQKHYDLDHEEEDLYSIMAAKHVEIAAIEARLSQQRGTPKMPAHMASPRAHLASSRPEDLHPLDREEEEAREAARRAEEDWEREERERKKWADAGRQRYNERDSLAADEYTVSTPISQYSWRDSYGGPVAPPGPGGKRAVSGGGRMSGGGEWEEFKYDEASPVVTRPRQGTIARESFLQHPGESGWATQSQDCGCGGYEHTACGPPRRI